MSVSVYFNRMTKVFRPKVKVCSNCARIRGQLDEWNREPVGFISDECGVCFRADRIKLIDS